MSGLIGWESVVIVYKGDFFVRIWFWGCKVVGRWVFLIGDGSNVLIVVISFCGLFVFVGFEMGLIKMFNF